MATGSSGAEGGAEAKVVAAGDGASGVLYKLAGMSVEERQQMLDLREEVHIIAGVGGLSIWTGSFCRVAYAHLRGGYEVLLSAYDRLE